MTVTVDFDPRARWRRGMTAALLNASGLGLGFLYLRLWGRAVVYWVGSFLLVVSANALNASHAPSFWAVIYGLWLLSAVGSGWRNGRGGWTATVRAPALAPVAGVLAIALAATALLVYRSMPGAELDKAEEAHAAGECADALGHYQRAAAVRYEFTLSPASAEAREGIAACRLLLIADDARDEGDLAAAIAAYETYLRRDGGPRLWDGAATRLPGLRLEQADALADEASRNNAWEGAGGYLEAFDAYFALRADYPDSPEAAEVGERVEAIYDARTTAFTERRYCQSINNLRQFAGTADRPGTAPELTEMAEQAGQALPEAIYGCGQTRYDDGRYCEAVGDFNEVARMSQASESLAGQARTQALRARYECGDGHRDDGEPCRAIPEFEAVTNSSTAPEPLGDDAEAALREALYDCGEARYQSGSYDEAREALQHLRDDYPDDPRADDAGDLLIAIDIAEISSDDSTGALPDPTEAGSGAAGVSTVEIENGSSETLEILYTGPETGSVTIDACDGCAQTLTLTPGDYEVVARASSDSTVIPFYGTWELSSGSAYSNYFYISFF